MENNAGKQKKVMAALCCINATLLLYQITNTVVAYIMGSYPDVTPSVITQAMTMPNLVGIFISLIIGPVAMKFSKKLLLGICGLCVLAQCMIYFLVGENGPFGLLLFASGLAGINMGANMTLVTSIINEYFPVERQASALGITSAVQMLGGAASGMAAGAIAAGNGGADWPKAYLVGLMIIPLFLIYMVLLPGDRAAHGGTGPSPAAELPAGGKVKVPVKSILLAVLNAFCGVGLACFMFNYSDYVINVHKLGTSVQAGAAYTIFMVSNVAMGLTYNVWQNLFKDMIGTVGYGECAIGLFLMFLITGSLAGMYIGALLVGMGFGLGSPYIMSKAMGEAPPYAVPVTMSIFFVFVNLSNYFALPITRALGNLIGGGVDNTILVGTIGVAVSVIILHFVYKSCKGYQPE